MRGHRLRAPTRRELRSQVFSLGLLGGAVEGRKRINNADEYMAAIAAERVVRHLERARFGVMKRLPIGLDNRAWNGTPVGY
jgi:hypothetical protein